MSASTQRRWGSVGLLTLATSACALTGYDFGDYERAAVNSAPAGAAGAAGAAGEANPFSTSLPSSGAGEGGAAVTLPSEGGAAAKPPSEGGAGATTRPTCFALGVECGPIPDGDGCGKPLECGACFWWFHECRQNRCVIPE